MEVCDISQSSPVQCGWSMETGRGREWLKVSEACGFGARRQFTRGWAYCTKEGGLPGNGEGNNQFGKNTLVFRGRGERERGIKICNKNHLNYDSVRVGENWEGWRQMSSGERKGDGLNNKVCHKVPNEVFAKTGNNNSYH